METETVVMKRTFGTGFNSIWEWKANWMTIAHDPKLSLAEELGKFYGAGEYMVFTEGDSIDRITVERRQVFVGVRD